MPHHILVVEDNEAEADLIVQALTMKGYRVTLASSGEQGLEILRESMPDMVVSDYIMPGINGIELLSQARMICPDAVRILITGYADLDAAIDAINQAQIYEFRTKPLKIKDFLLTIERGLERHDLIEHLKQSDKLACVGELAAGIAHEINNPLGFVKANLDILIDYFMITKRLLKAQSDMAKAARRSDLSEIQAALGQIDPLEEVDIPAILKDTDEILLEMTNGIERIEEISSGLKNLTRINDGEWTETDLNEVIEDALKLVWNELNHKCMIRRDLEDLPMVRCQAGQLRQVFMNLLINAAQAIPHYGQITIQTRMVDAHLIIRISDTGQGIPKDIQSKIFAPFFTTKPTGIGTGLGLSVSFGIIRQHRGTIGIESEVGVGTTFTIRLPVAPKGVKVGVVASNQGGATHQKEDEKMRLSEELIRMI